LILDEIGNRLPHQPHRIKPLFYFFTYRLGKRFSVSAVSDIQPCACEPIDSAVAAEA